MFKAPPEKYVARRRITLQGVAYSPGQQVPDDVVVAIRDLDALLSRGYISGDPDQHGRRTSPGTPTPTSTPATVRRALRERAASAVAEPVAEEPVEEPAAEPVAEEPAPKASRRRRSSAQE